MLGLVVQGFGGLGVEGLGLQGSRFQTSARLPNNLGVKLRALRLHCPRVSKGRV